MVNTQLLGTAWTVWTVSRSRLGPVGAALATAVAVVGLVTLGPRVAERYPAVARLSDVVNRPADAPSG